LSSNMVKVLVAGDVRGKLDHLFATAKKVKDAKGIDILFCVGQFLGSSSTLTELRKYMLGEKKVPLPTYFILGDEDQSYGLDIINDLKIADAGGEICTNLHYLGRCGIRTIEGLRIAFISGVPGIPFTRYLNLSEITAREEKYSPDYYQSDLKNITHESKADILLTSSWASGWDRLMTQKEIDQANVDPAWGRREIVEVVLETAPQYHFAGHHDRYFVLHPYQVDDLRVTRFIALGHVVSASRNRAFYACSVVTAKNAITSKVATTACPYSQPQKSWRIGQESSRKRQRQDNDEVVEEPPRVKKKLVKKASCFLCQGPHKDLIAKSEEMVLAFTKRPLSKEHLCVIPSSHEMQMSKEDIFQLDILPGLAKCFGFENKGLIFWENCGRNSHTNMQILAQTKDVVKGFSEIVYELMTGTDLTFFPMSLEELKTTEYYLMIGSHCDDQSQYFVAPLSEKVKDVPKDFLFRMVEEILNRSEEEKRITSLKGKRLLLKETKSRLLMDLQKKIRPYLESAVSDKVTNEPLVRSMKWIVTPYAIY